MEKWEQEKTNVERTNIRMESRSLFQGTNARTNGKTTRLTC